CCIGSSNPLSCCTGSQTGSCMAAVNAYACTLPLVDSDCTSKGWAGTTQASCCTGAGTGSCSKQQSPPFVSRMPPARQLQLSKALVTATFKAEFVGDDHGIKQALCYTRNLTKSAYNPSNDVTHVEKWHPDQLIAATGMTRIIK